MICNKCGTEHLSPTETCPYDNRQVPVKPQPTMTDDDSPNVACYKLGYNVGFNIGFRDAIQQCREAVGEIKIEYYKFFISRPAVLAAISKVEGEIK